MKKLIYSLVFLLLFIACSEDNDPQIVGSGTIINQTRNIDAFQKVSISSTVNARISFGSSTGLTVSADDNIIDLVETRVENGTLFISLEDGNYNDITIDVDATSPELIALSSSGVNNITIAGYEDVDALEVEMTGVGNISASGSANQLTIISSGSTSFSGFDFVATNCTVNLSGVSNVEITANESLNGNLSGVGNIFYKGSPTVEVNVTGVGNTINSN